MLNDTQLDPTNLKLLELLKLNGRQSATAFGEALGLSRTAVQDRMRRLEDTGVIAGYTVRVNRPADQPFQALVYGSILERPCASTLAWLRRLSGVEKVVSVSGKTDVVIWVALADAAALSDFVDIVSANEKMGAVTSQVILQIL
ncbi:MAG: Lrp/AsnC family transcriptional regulator [Hyphomicrobiales bacterium]